MRLREKLPGKIPYTARRVTDLESEISELMRLIQAIRGAQRQYEDAARIARRLSIMIDPAQRTYPVVTEAISREKMLYEVFQVGFALYWEDLELAVMKLDNLAEQLLFTTAGLMES